jgi:hypothetical protein
MNTVLHTTLGGLLGLILVSCLGNSTQPSPPSSELTAKATPYSYAHHAIIDTVKEREGEIHTIRLAPTCEWDSIAQKYTGARLFDTIPSQYFFHTVQEGLLLWQKQDCESVLWYGPNTFPGTWHSPEYEYGLPTWYAADSRCYMDSSLTVASSNDSLPLDSSSNIQHTHSLDSAGSYTQTLTIQPKGNVTIHTSFKAFCATKYLAMHWLTSAIDSVYLQPKDCYTWKVFYNDTTSKADYGVLTIASLDIPNQTQQYTFAYQNTTCSLLRDENEPTASQCEQLAFGSATPSELDDWMDCIKGSNLFAPSAF